MSARAIENQKSSPSLIASIPTDFSGADLVPLEYSPLGVGNHSCLGRAIVQVTASTALTVLARDFDWNPTADGPREFGAFHWMPSRQFRIAVSRRSPPNVENHTTV